MDSPAHLRKYALRLVGVLVSLGLVFTLLLVSGVAYARQRIDATAQRQVSYRLEEVEQGRVALVLGCSRFLSDGRENLYFRYRMDAAAALFHAGKVRTILVSGDNARPSYNESEDMKAALIERGVPARHITCDYAGFSTFDSVLRAKKVFGLEGFVVVSQEFHVKRAIYIAESIGLDASGFACLDVSGASGLRTNLREQLAKLRAVLDVEVIGRKPKYLGEAEAIDS